MQFRTKFLLIMFGQFLTFSLGYIFILFIVYYKEAPNIIQYDHESLELKYDDFLMQDRNAQYQMQRFNLKSKLSQLFLLQDILDQTGSDQIVDLEYYNIGNQETDFQFLSKYNYLSRLMKFYLQQFDQVLLLFSNNIVIRFSQNLADENFKQRLQLYMQTCQNQTVCLAILNHTLSQTEASIELDSQYIYFSILWQSQQLSCKVEVRISVYNITRSFDYGQHTNHYFYLQDQTYILNNRSQLVQTAQDPYILDIINSIQPTCTQQILEKYNDNNTYITISRLHIHNIFYQCEHKIKFHSLYLVKIEDINCFDKKFQRIPFEKILEPFMILIIIFCVIQGSYILLITIRIGNSLHFPVKFLVDLLKQDIRLHQQEEYNIRNFHFLLNSYEIKELVRSSITLLNSIKYYSIILDNDYDFLQYCKAKIFFKKQQNLKNVSICASNIALMHFKKKRYLEALNELQEAIHISQQEYNNFKVSQLTIETAKKLKEPNELIQLFQRFKKYILTRFLKYDVDDQVQYIRRITQQSVRQSNNTILNQLSQQNIQQSLRVSTFNAVDNLITENDCTFRPISDKVEFDNQDFKHEMRVLKQVLYLREYYYGLILSKLNSNLFFEECLLIFERLSYNIIKAKRKTLLMRSILINVNIKSAYIHLKCDQTDIAWKYIYEAEDAFNNTRCFYFPDHIPFIETVSRCPEQIMRQKICILKAKYYVHQQKYFISSQILLDQMIQQDKYDNKYYQYCLKLLHYIFEKNSLQISLLNEMKIETRYKNLILLIDYSKYMKKDQLILSHSICQQIIYLMPQQTVLSLIAFNEQNLFKIINRQIILNNKYHLQKVLYNLLIPPAGECKVFHTLNDVFEQYYEHNHENIICLFSQGTRDYSKEEHEKLRKLSITLKIKLLVFNIAQENSKALVMKIISETSKNFHYFTNDEDFIQYFNHPRDTIQKGYFEFL